MPQELRPVRRIVTGVDSQGRSCIVDDGESPATRTVAERPGYRSANIWRTVGNPTPIAAPDSVVEQRGVAPPPGGTVLRVIDIPPESPDPELRRRQIAATFAALFGDARRDGDTAIHPGMHATDTVDYAIVIEGELTAILETEQTVLRPGDILVQRGTEHAWANRSGATVRVAFILIDAKR